MPSISPKSVVEFIEVQLQSDRYTQYQIANLACVTVETVCKIALKEHAHQRDGQIVREPVYLPTPNEILSLCEAIRQTWDEQTFRRRACLVDEECYQIPMISRSEIDLTI